MINRKSLVGIIALALSSAAWAGVPPTTQVQYLSGHGCDDMVQWDFKCSGGNNSGKWTKIGVPSCWECQGFGTFQYGMKFYGKAFPEGIADEKGEYKYDPYVGWGVELPDDSTLDYAHLGGVTYWYKGCAHEIHVETSDVKDYDVHLATVKASRTWKQVFIRFKDLAQGGWGEEVEFDPAHITAVSFQAKGNRVKDSVLIDNVYFQDTSEVAKDTADMQIMDPEIPEVTIPAYSAHLGHRESLDSFHLIAVAGAVVTSRNSVGADLNHPERSSRTWKSLPKTMGYSGNIGVGAGADKRIDIIRGRFLFITA